MSEKVSEMTDQGLGQGLGLGQEGLGGVSMGVSMLGDDLENENNVDLDQSAGDLGSSSNDGLTSTYLSASSLKDNSHSSGVNDGSSGGGGGGGGGMTRARPPRIQTTTSTTPPATTPSHTRSPTNPLHDATNASPHPGPGAWQNTGTAGSGSTAPSVPVSPSVMATAAWPQTHDSNNDHSNNDHSNHHHSNKEGKNPVFTFDFPSQQDGENRNSGVNSSNSGGSGGSEDHSGVSSSSKKLRPNRGSVSVISGSQPVLTYPPNDLLVTVPGGGDMNANTGTTLTLAP